MNVYLRAVTHHTISLKFLLTSLNSVHLLSSKSDVFRGTLDHNVHTASVYIISTDMISTALFDSTPYYLTPD